MQSPHDLYPRIRYGVPGGVDLTISRLVVHTVGCGPGHRIGCVRSLPLRGSCFSRHRLAKVISTAFVRFAAITPPVDDAFPSAAMVTA